MSTGDKTLDAALADPSAQFLFFRGQEALLEGADPVLITRTGLPFPEEMFASAIIVEHVKGAPRLALDVSHLTGGDGASPISSGEFRNLRRLQEPVAPEAWRLLARARALLSWHQSHPVCPSCGAPTRPEMGGAIRVCSDESCAQIHYPRTDPSVIVRLVNGERCLLARQPQFSPEVRSVLAGFVEPGERLEDAVRREVAEEVGIRVGKISYLGSQAWPFPMSLMIAFEAEALTDEIRLDDEELEQADWYTREDVRRDLDAGELILPSPKSIARRMIDEWLAAPSG